MAANNDPPRVVGAVVHALASHVTAQVECGRRYGALQDSKMLTGTVTEVRFDASGRRRSTFVTASYHLGGLDYESKELNVRSVHVGKAPATVPTPGDISLLVGVALLSPVAEKDGAGQQSSPLLTVPGSQAPALPAAAIQSTIVVHDTEWIRGNYELPVNGPLQYRPWALRTPTGETLSAAGGTSERPALDLFLLMFPPLQLQEMRRLTNRELQAKGKTPTTPGEIIKYLGVLFLMTRFEFDERASL
jgi:hypothetical protein